ncbi:hypothetical protein GOP47_0024061 [Adiantum capillus-veneris]|uniref:Uncharacterized protein n=1 Tax=Adiantum capillus-veneris TaxID=13818 RepID=A0A9D4Z6J2_ADICA|nr:hypothetical protein GOP47_0024061 [Adiantum capillus-veneris]
MLDDVGELLRGDPIWIWLQAGSSQVCLPHDGFGFDMHSGMVTFDDEGYESDKETSSCSDGGESFDDELRSFILSEFKDKEAIHQSLKALEVKAGFKESDSETASTCDLSLGGNDTEVMHDKANGLTVSENMYNSVYEDALDLNSQEEGAQGLVSHEVYVRPVAGKSENASAEEVVEEVMSLCDEENVCEEVVQVEGLFHGAVMISVFLIASCMKQVMVYPSFLPLILACRRCNL